ncbi:MAG: ribonuclease P protein component [Patescibacteria group bacterium]|nr:ribonuclease P protein component [Patescibacteria group bacterium]MDD5164459.1 ribonuclease P protein component [Patescibacteria group bacterium]MDD5534378.1 ribonuclease P protein component [Patescibacteria group bacterium]
MLSREYRLTKNKDFGKVAKFGKQAWTQYFGLKWLKNDLKNSRFGIVVSLKVDKKAVVRNRIKRRIRAILDIRKKDIKSGFDFMILTRTEIKNLDYWQIDDILKNILHKENLFTNEK